MTAGSSIGKHKNHAGPFAIINHRFYLHKPDAILLPDPPKSGYFNSTPSRRKASLLHKNIRSHPEEKNGRRRRRQPFRIKQARKM